MIYTIIAKPQSPARAIESGNALRALVSTLQLDWSIGVIDTVQVYLLRVTCPDRQADVVLNQLEYMTGHPVPAERYQHALPFDNAFANEQFGRTVTMLLTPTAHAQVLDGALLREMKSAWLTCVYGKKTALAYVRCHADDVQCVDAHALGWRMMMNPAPWHLRRWRTFPAPYTNDVSLMPIDTNGADRTAPDRCADDASDNDPRFTPLEEVFHG